MSSSPPPRQLRGIQLRSFLDSLSQNVASRVSFHDPRHGLLHEWFHAREPMAVHRPQVVSRFHADHHEGNCSSNRRPEAQSDSERKTKTKCAHIIQEFGTGVRLDVMSKSPHRSWMSIQILLLVVASGTSLTCTKGLRKEGEKHDRLLTSVTSDGREMFHLYEEKEDVSAQGVHRTPNYNPNKVSNAKDTATKTYVWRSFLEKC